MRQRTGRKLSTIADRNRAARRRVGQTCAPGKGSGTQDAPRPGRISHRNRVDEEGTLGGRRGHGAPRRPARPVARLGARPVQHSRGSLAPPPPVPPLPPGPSRPAPLQLPPPPPAPP